MTGLDTNILVRYFVRDEPAQFARARRLIEKVLSRENPGYVSVAVLVELSWVLERSYKLPPQVLADVLSALLSSEVFVLQHELQVHIAYRALRGNQAQFADALISALAQSAGCSTTYTFDRKAARLPGFKLL